MKGNDSEPDSKVSFRHKGRKRHETIIPRYSRVSLVDNFFNDVESYSVKLADLHDTRSLPWSSYYRFLFFSLCFFSVFISTE